MEPIPYTPKTCIILVEIEKGDTVSLVGIVVDSVSEVLSIAGVDIEEPPSLGGVSSNYILGIAKREQKSIILLSSRT